MRGSRYADRFTALIDACVLGGALRRNLLLSLADAGLFRPRWSVRILDETQKAISKITNGQTDGSHQREAIEAAFPEAIVTGFAGLGNRVETPFEFAGVGVIGPHMARRTAIGHDAVEDLRADDDAAADGDGRRAASDVVHLEFESAEIAAQVDEAIVAETRVGLARKKRILAFIVCALDCALPMLSAGDACVAPIVARLWRDTRAGFPVLRRGESRAIPRGRC